MSGRNVSSTRLRVEGKSPDNVFSFPPLLILFPFVIRFPSYAYYVLGLQLFIKNMPTISLLLLCAVIPEATSRRNGSTLGWALAWVRPAATKSLSGPPYITLLPLRPPLTSGWMGGAGFRERGATTPPSILFPLSRLYLLNVITVLTNNITPAIQHYLFTFIPLIIYIMQSLFRYDCHHNAPFIHTNHHNYLLLPSSSRPPFNARIHYLYHHHSTSSLYLLINS